MKHFAGIIEDLFHISSVFLIILCVFELFFPKFASPYINLNILLIIAVLSGIITVIKSKI
ncbi:hypothetical protein A2Y83_00955 [Candidatus Falkowbacteria bacterium RBG_13_39_14]|uniref:Uncharacterized protein n=1 Tax=Candidatus Falkowbacteria bacterium RBG_13_39_14 TaxID=1797985 RepID=A0A1F5S6A2_9BACT|nr:MAG: hypothetical protein A2Y83_00955 [Candidatus Falkowbacteria bacterium RBG_13_39_14]